MLEHVGQRGAGLVHAFEAAVTACVPVALAAPAPPTAPHLNHGDAALAGQQVVVELVHLVAHRGHDAHAGHHHTPQRRLVLRVCVLGSQVEPSEGVGAGVHWPAAGAHACMHVQLLGAACAGVHACPAGVRVGSF